MSALRFIEDAGHGWLEVPVHQLRKLGIVDEITRYSYLSTCGRFAYLEEDCDLRTYVVAAGDSFEWPDVDQVHVRGDAFVRSLPRFTPSNVATLCHA